jgi:DNA primase
MCDYGEQVVQRLYNKFHMCLLGRLTKHIWNCHPTDRNIRLNKKCAELLQLYQERFQQQQQQLTEQEQRPKQQQQVDPTEEFWDNDTYPHMFRRKKTYEKQSPFVRNFLISQNHINMKIASRL